MFPYNLALRFYQKMFYNSYSVSFVNKVYKKKFIYTIFYLHIQI